MRRSRPGAGGRGGRRQALEGQIAEAQGRVVQVRELEQRRDALGKQVLEAETNLAGLVEELAQVETAAAFAGRATEEELASRANGHWRRGSSTSFAAARYGGEGGSVAGGRRAAAADGGGGRSLETQRTEAAIREQAALGGAAAGNRGDGERGRRRLRDGISGGRREKIAEAKAACSEEMNEAAKGAAGAALGRRWRRGHRNWRRRGGERVAVKGREQAVLAEQMTAAKPRGGGKRNCGCSSRQQELQEDWSGQLGGEIADGGDGSAEGGGGGTVRTGAGRAAAGGVG